MSVYFYNVALLAGLLQKPVIPAVWFVLTCEMALYPTQGVILKEKVHLKRLLSTTQRELPSFRQCPPNFKENTYLWWPLCSVDCLSVVLLPFLTERHEHRGNVNQRMFTWALNLTPTVAYWSDCVFCFVCMYPWRHHICVPGDGTCYHTA